MNEPRTKVLLTGATGYVGQHLLKRLVEQGVFVMRLKTRCVHIAGVTPTPNEAFMQQVVRNLTDVSDGFLLDSKFIIFVNGLI